MNNITREQLNLQRVMHQNIVIGEIMRLALLVNNVMAHHVNIEYKGSENLLCCEIANKGWYEDKEQSRKNDYHVNLNHENAYLLLEVIKNYLARLYIEQVEREMMKDFTK